MIDFVESHLCYVLQSEFVVAGKAVESLRTLYKIWGVHFMLFGSVASTVGTDNSEILHLCIPCSDCCTLEGKFPSSAVLKKLFAV